jgi:zinc transport system ATP-binding protein
MKNPQQQSPLKSILISAKNIDVMYGSQKALDNISLDVSTNDLITIVGPNGAGKSTLIKCLLGIIKPTSGTITRQKNLNIGYVPQSINIDKNLPLLVKDFLYLNKKPNKEKLQEIFKNIAIKPLLTKSMADLSGGEKQKVLLARSLLDNPQILVLDEVAAGMDISSQLEFYNLIETIWQEYNLAIVMISHDLHMVMAKSKQVLCLFKHICCSGKPEQVASNPEFVKLFGKSIDSTLAIYNHHHDHTHGELKNG